VDAMPSMLAVGSDEALLRTRVAVLHRFKASVTHANLDTALKILHITSFDLVMLCHSLSLADTVRIGGLDLCFAACYRGSVEPELRGSAR
jgi:CheY-like chemotaxis protein